MDQSVQMSPEASSRSGFERKRIFLISGLVIMIFAVAGGYFLWPDSKTENEASVSSQSNMENASMSVAPSQPPTPIENPIIDQKVATPISTGPSTVSSQEKQNESRSAAKAFEEQYKNNLETSKIDPAQEIPAEIVNKEEKRVAEQKAEEQRQTEAKRIAERTKEQRKAEARRLAQIAKERRQAEARKKAEREAQYQWAPIVLVPPKTVETPQRPPEKYTADPAAPSSDTKDVMNRLKNNWLNR
ncbi:MAG: hypothetical protein ACRERV_10585 [Methylococcales bacterium]